MFESGDAGMADEIVADGYANHDAADPPLNVEEVKAAVTKFKEAFPDARLTMSFQLAEGDRVASRYTWSGTHQGEFAGIPATGKAVNWTSTVTFRIAGGKISEAWLSSDRLSLMQQLGVVPTPESA
jgi:steroid delta-isomerase-like uncharacterized protein